MSARLIPNKLVATFAAILTGYLAVLAFRDAISHRIQQPHWLLPMAFGLPHWAQFGLNVAFYGYLVWLAVEFFRFFRGKERILVVGWFLGLVLYPIEIFVGQSTAIVIKGIEAAAMGAAFFASLDIFLRSIARRTDADQEPAE